MIAAEQIEYLQNRILRFDDQEAYKELFTGLYGNLYHFALSFTKSKELSEEIVSDVFIKVWENRNKLSEIGNLQAYLYVVTGNIASQYLENQKNAPFTDREGVASKRKGNYSVAGQLTAISKILMIIRRALLQ